MPIKSLSWTAAALFFALGAVGALAQEEAPAQKKKSEDRTSSSSSPFFQEARVDFWGDAPKTAPRAKDKDSAQTNRAESIWAEPIRRPDGGYSVYVPPQAVLEFLEHPSRESGEKYLAWQEERARKLRTAMELLARLKAERSPHPKEERADRKTPERNEGDGKSSSRLAVASAATNEILYFKKPGCPYCAEEDKAFAELSRSHPGLHVRVVSPETAPELWKEYGVTVVPSLVISAAGGKKYMIRGYLPAEDLARTLSEVNRVEK